MADCYFAAGSQTDPHTVKLALGRSYLLGRVASGFSRFQCKTFDVLVFMIFISFIAIKVKKELNTVEFEKKNRCFYSPLVAVPVQYFFDRDSDTQIKAGFSV